MARWSIGRTGWNARGYSSRYERQLLEESQARWKDAAVALCYRLIDVMGEAAYNEWLESVQLWTYSWPAIAKKVAEQLTALGHPTEAKIDEQH